MPIITFIMYNGFIFDEKGVFYNLTTLSSFTENVSINFEQKFFKSLANYMLFNSVTVARVMLKILCNWFAAGGCVFINCKNIFVMFVYIN